MLDMSLQTSAMNCLHGIEYQPGTFSYRCTATKNLPTKIQAFAQANLAISSTILNISFSTHFQAYTNLT